jgi:hypothetical protein
MRLGTAGIACQTTHCAMTTPRPKYITRKELEERLQHEIRSLTGTDLSWWTAHRITPFAARHDDLSHFIVAASGQNIILFADEEDEFGVAKLDAAKQMITHYGLIGDLRDAVRIIQETAV